MKERFNLSCRYEDMSPVLIPSGYTKDFIHGRVSLSDQEAALSRSFNVRMAGKSLRRPCLSLD